MCNADNTIVKNYLSGLSMCQISEKYNLSYSAVRKVIVESGVMRTRSEAISMGKKNKVHIHSQLIIEKYKEGNPIYKIQKNLGVSYNSIKKVLQRNGIVMRTKSEANSLSKQRSLVLPLNILKIINGELLGDGSISRGTSQSRFCFVSKHEDYAKWLADIFTNNGIELCGDGVKKILHLSQIS